MQQSAVASTALLRLEDVIARIHDAVHGSSAPLEAVRAVKRELSSCLEHRGWLPDCCQQPTQECYARHLIHRDAQDRFSIVAMVWNPGQKTPVHDHGGVWCVEGVYAGRLAITRYDLLESRQDGISRFRRHDQVLEGVGDTGALIPPVDFHTIENPTGGVAVTVHVYGCDMKTCHVYLPRPDGDYEVFEKQLQYTTKLR